MSFIKRWDRLFDLDAKARVRIWDLWIEDEGTPVLVTQHGLEGGALQTERLRVEEGKNVGKKNETTPYEQAVRVGQKKWEDRQTKHGYRTRVQDVQKASVNKQALEWIPPMLASPWTPTLVSYPCIVQPKLDGVRALVYREGDSIVAQSRTGARFTSCAHITDALQAFFATHPHSILDGELYSPTLSFETLVGMVKQTQVTHGSFSYHVFDQFEKAQVMRPYHERCVCLQALPDSPWIVTVPSVTVQNEHQVDCALDAHILQGYEGIILRDPMAAYEIKMRSKKLVKKKKMHEDEFRVVGFKAGKGREAHCVIWTCETETGGRFDVRPKGTHAERQGLLEEAEQRIGKMYTVIYQEKSAKGIPRFPVGKAFREDY